MGLLEGKRMYVSLYNNFLISSPIAFSVIYTVYIIFLVRAVNQDLCINTDIYVHCMLPAYWYVVKFCYFYSRCIAIYSREESSHPSWVYIISPWKCHFLFLVRNFRKLNNLVWILHLTFFLSSWKFWKKISHKVCWLKIIRNWFSHQPFSHKGMF